MSWQTHAMLMAFGPFALFVLLPLLAGYIIDGWFCAYEAECLENNSAKSSVIGLTEE